MRFFDLHCDTFYRMASNDNLFKNKFHVSISKGRNLKPWIQCFAIWIPDELSADQGFELFKNLYKKFKIECTNKPYIRQCFNFDDIYNINKENKIGAILTLENSKPLGTNLKRLKFLKDCGVKIITLTWNGDSLVGSGCEIKNSKGLTKFGQNLIELMNEYSIVPDVSHASDKLFYDVIEYSKKPKIATHANSRSVCNHKRNLTDDQFNLIKKAGGIVGINFCKYFLSENIISNFSDIRYHIDHFLSLGGEKTIAIGSDFDGADMSEEMLGIESIISLYEYFLKSGYNEQIIKDIFFNNSYNFFQNSYN